MCLIVEEVAKEILQCRILSVAEIPSGLLLNIIVAKVMMFATLGQVIIYVKTMLLFCFVIKKY